MNEFMIGVGSALWLGILTSISPCPLATNIAAISYIGRKVGNSRQIFLTGLLYTLGRTVAYLGLAFVLVASVLSMPQISLFLQKYISLALGPILERSFLQSLYLTQGNWVEILQRPIAGSMFVIALLVLLVPMLKWLAVKIHRKPLFSA